MQETKTNVKTMNVQTRQKMVKPPLQKFTKTPDRNLRKYPQSSSYDNLNQPP